jgi:hypothetical protein
MFVSRPSEPVPTFYEQMFASASTSKLAQRSLGALRLTRSFLLLEDDYDVDWEVDWDETETHIHPHRVPLRGPGRRLRRHGERRPGESPALPQHCLSPVGDSAGVATAARPSAARRRLARSDRAIDQHA